MLRKIRITIEIESDSDIQIVKELQATTKLAELDEYNWKFVSIKVVSATNN